MRPMRMRFLLVVGVAALLPLTAFTQQLARDADIAAAMGIVNARATQYGARADGKTDDTAALKAAIADARTAHAPLYLPAGTYRISSTLDVTGLDVTGAGRDNTVLRLDDNVQQNAVVSRGNSALRNFEIHGGWDGRTPNLKGSGFAMLSDPTAKPAYLGYEVRLDNVSVQYSKENCIVIEQGSYESLHNVKCNAAGQHGLFLDSGKTPGFATTTVNVDGLSIFSDVSGYAVYIKDGQTVSFSGRTTMENTGGICLAGINGRTLKISGVHQENTRGGKFLTAADSSGIGLTLTDNFLAGTPITPESPNELAHWFNITVDGNPLGNTYGTGSPVVVKNGNLPEEEPMEVVPGGWRFHTGQATTMGVAPHGNVRAWTLRLIGNWVTPGLPQPVAHELVLTNVHPAVEIGTGQIRFGLDQSARLSAQLTGSASGSEPIEFLGVVEFVTDRQHDSSDEALQTPSKIVVGSEQVRALAGSGDAPVCASPTGELHRCRR